MLSVPASANPGISVVIADMGDIVEALGDSIERLAGKTVLITGAGGMLAAYLADAIAYANMHVLSRPARMLLLTRSAPSPFSRLAHLTDREDVEFLVQDVCTPVEVTGQIDFIVHAASPATPRSFRLDPVGTVDSNSLALRGLLDLARQRDVESFLFFSSSEIYGSPEPERIPTPETYIGKFDFTLSRSFYAASKRFGETLCAAFREQYRVPVKVVRPFHIHGPGVRLDDGRIVAEMIRSALDGKPLELQSDGKATRTYGYISDAATAFLKVLLSDYNGEAFNVGTDSPETSILELAQTISNLFGRTEPVRTTDIPSPPGSPLRVCPDLNKARRLLGYNPRVGLEDGLQRTVRWLEQQHQMRRENN